MAENPDFLTKQIITYIGNKRALLPFIMQGVEEVKAELGAKPLSGADLFAGSGIVARGLMEHCGELVVNDLEDYALTLSRCYLSSEKQRAEFDLDSMFSSVKLALGQGLEPGFITRLYSPMRDDDIAPGERVFYTRRNAMYIDTARRLIAHLPPRAQPFFIAPLLYEASVKANTAGVFKGFYKDKRTGAGQFGGTGRDALGRIRADIDLPFPVFSQNQCDVTALCGDANAAAAALPPMDIVYLDPPYNQHPYGSNYFMLNLIDSYAEPRDISRVSGIPPQWNRSRYNKSRDSLDALIELCGMVQAKYLLISFSSEGFIPKEILEYELSRLGRLTVRERRYNVFRGSRNLRNRPIHNSEYLFILKKQ